MRPPLTRSRRSPPVTRSRGSSLSATEVTSFGAGSVAIGKSRGWRRFLAFSGPAYLVSVGYMDPGNWATDIEAGARFGYQLLWVLAMSNLMAILLQTLCARLGIATGRDLAQSCREHYPKPINLALWVLCEAAIAACDLAEVLGSAIALKLLFGIPLLWGVVITALDALLILYLSRYGIRLLERIVLGMIFLIGACFAVQILLARPDFAAVAGGLTPRLTGESLYVAIGMLGATVMPHNLYLHSALVQTREIEDSDESKREASRFNLLDSATALTAALFVNGAILVLASAAFHARGIVVTEIEQAHQLLSPLLGTTLASFLFALALLASGQSSTFTGTLAGQIVMEGFLNLRMRLWMRLMLTRMVAIVPAVAVIAIIGERGTYPLLIFSQVLLSLQLPFAIVPLVHFTGNRERMGVLTSPGWLRALAWLTTGLVVALNIWLAARTLSGVWGLVIATPLALLLGYIALEPWLRRRPMAPSVVLPEAPVDVAAEAASYRTILVPLDHSELDRVALRHAVSMAKVHGAKLILLHVEESVTSQVYGEMAKSAEEREGLGYLQSIHERLAAESVLSETVTTYSGRPGDQIVRVAKDCHADLVIMGAHGHKGLKDIIFGSTINAVRHNLTIPVLVIRKPSE